jgi:hypothetical protein
MKLQADYMDLVLEKTDEIYQDLNEFMTVLYDSGRDIELAALLVDIAGTPASNLRKKTAHRLADLVESIIEQEAHKRLGEET